MNNLLLSILNFEISSLCSPFKWELVQLWSKIYLIAERGIIFISLDFFVSNVMG